MRTSGGLEVAEIFRQHGPAYRESHRLSRNAFRVMRAIEVCRTADLGGHKDQCDHCGHLEISYNSCRNRHCPKCQTLRKERWIEARSEDLLPIEYFHVVFTIHWIVTGGGLSPDGSQWVSCRKGFFIHVRVLSALFSRKFLGLLGKSFKSGDLVFPGKITHLKELGHSN